MNYIVLDLEWNQGNRENERDEKLPFEIIEIGAVKVNSAGEITDEFCELIKPAIYHEMHRITEQLIHIQMDDLTAGRPFPSVCRDFLQWCGEDRMFCTWGTLDLVELQRNMEYYEIPPLSEVPFAYLDIQKLFSIAYEDRRTRRNLEFATDYLGILKQEPFHRAISDAYYTAKVFTYVLARKPEVIRNVSYDVYHPPKTREQEVRVVFDTYAKYISRVFESKKEAFADKEVSSSKCYLCHKNLRKKMKWFTLNNKHYYCLACCGQHGYIKYKLRLQKANDGGAFVVKTSRFITEKEKEELIARKEHADEIKKRRKH